MVKKVIWTSESERTFAAVIEYLEEKWTQREIIAFIQKTNQVISHIKSFPAAYRSAGKTDVREAVITSQNILLYRISGNTVYLLYFWNTKRNPAKRPL